MKTAMEEVTNLLDSFFRELISNALDALDKIR